MAEPKFKEGQTVVIPSYKERTLLLICRTKSTEEGFFYTINSFSIAQHNILTEIKEDVEMANSEGNERWFSENQIEYPPSVSEVKINKTVLNSYDNRKANIYTIF